MREKTPTSRERTFAHKVIPRTSRYRPHDPVTLGKQDWHEYFERLSRAVVESRAESEVAALPHGLQTDADWVKLAAVRYDPSATSSRWGSRWPTRPPRIM